MKDIPISPRIKEIRRNRNAHRLRLGILFLILLIITIYALAIYSGNERLRIDKINIIGTHILDQEKIEKEIRDNIAGKYIYLFSKSNSLIYPKKQVYNNLISKFPRIESLSIKRDGFRTLNIEISERVGEYLYCGSSVPKDLSQIGENCYFVNNDGFIFDKAPYFSGNVYFKYYLPLEDTIINPLGNQMIDANHFHNLSRFVDGITALGFKPIYISRDKDGINSLYLNYNMNNIAPRITFKDGANFETLLANLSIAMEKKEFANEINSKYDKLLYIDLRFENKILYKFD